MDKHQALSSFAALSQETRLGIVRDLWWPGKKDLRLAELPNSWVCLPPMSRSI